MDMNTKKAAYEAPEVVKHGSFEQLTEAGATGPAIDADFPNKTPVSDLTFS